MHLDGPLDISWLCLYDIRLTYFEVGWLAQGNSDLNVPTSQMHTLMLPATEFQLYTG